MEPDTQLFQVFQGNEEVSGPMIEASALVLCEGLNAERLDEEIEYQVDYWGTVGEWRSTYGEALQGDEEPEMMEFLS
ncbi:MAG: hypothetical protein AAGB19_01170 [Cyanobacteria bacterium P01_F01_bin.3]